MPALDRTLALDEWRTVPWWSASSCTSMTRPQVDARARRIAKGRARFRPAAHRVGKVGPARHGPHPLATPAGHRFDEQRVSDSIGDPRHFSVGHI